MKKLIALALLLGCGVAQAAALTWTLEDVSFDDLTDVTGAFDYDADTDVYSNWNLVTQSGAFTAFSWDALNSIDIAGTATHLEIATPSIPSLTRVLLFDFASSLTNAGGTIDITTDTLCQYQSGSCEVDLELFATRYVTGGSVSAVPVPAAVWLFGSGLGLLGFVRRKKIFAE